MAEFWLDSNVFIEGKKGPYAFDITPHFWVFLDQMASAGRLAIPEWVYRELMDAQDALADWARERRTSGIVVPDSGVQDDYERVVNYVNSNYRRSKSLRRFLDKADPWVIAHALSDGGTVVTLEKPARAGQRDRVVKIPDVCQHFGIRCIDTRQMLQDLDFSQDS